MQGFPKGGNLSKIGEINSKGANERGAILKFVLYILDSSCRWRAKKKVLGAITFSNSLKGQFKKRFCQTLV